MNIHEYQAKNMILGMIDWNRRAEVVTGADKKRGFEFEIQAARCGKDRLRRVWRLDLPARPTDLTTANDN